MILIADSGSTKTDWCLIEGAVVIKQFQTVGINPYFQDSDSILALVKAEVASQLNNSPSAIYYYGTGITDDSKAEIVANVLKKCFVNSHTIEVYSDIVGAARSALGKNTGIACILGTGSNTCFYENGKILFKVDALGFWLGDEGSGGHLGKALILAYLHKEMPQDLRSIFIEKYGNLDRLTILDFAYKQPFPNRYFAGFTPFLSQHQTHPFCQALIKNSFQELFNKYISKYPDYQSFALGFVGSVAWYFKAELQEIAQQNQCKITKIIKSPIEGLIAYHQ